MKQIITLVYLCFISINTFAANSAQIGIFAQDITPHQDELIPLGGYGSPERREWFNFFRRRPHWRMMRVSEGVLDPIRAKAMYINNNGKKLLFVSLDVIGVTKEMHEDLITRLEDEGFASQDVIVSGTHTHSGPGALSPNPVWIIMAMDRFQKEYYQHFLDQVVDTVKQAIASAETSKLYTLSFDTTDLVHNRRGSDRPIYPKANLMLVESMDGTLRGGMINYAVHGTWHDADNLLFSSDVPGAIEISMQDLLQQKNGYVRKSIEPYFLFVNGAEGDISPHQEYHALGKSFAEQANANWNLLSPMEPAWEVKQSIVDMGKPKVNLSKCVKQSWIPKNLNIGLKRWISNTTVISQVHFGNLWMMTWPGEPTTELGMRLREMTKNNGAEDTWVLGLSNDHMAYFVTPEEFETGGYEACTNFFGAQGGVKIIEAHQELLQKF